jgi:phospholipid-binding lipoprotein MlaA
VIRAPSCALRRALPFLLLVGALAGCAAPPGEREWDPWEGFNRKIFWFNERVDDLVLEPTARGWVHITTQGFREGVQNFTDNLRFPVQVVNNLLQARFGDAGRCTARFVVNTTIGLLGIYDPASVWGLGPAPADFGQTLAVWGVNEGPYLVLPFLGPSDPRDATGLLADYLVEREVLPGSYFFLGAYVVGTVNWRGQNLQNIEEAREASIDYYTAVRSAWLDHRRRAIGVMLPPPGEKAEAPSEQPEDPYDVDSAINP